MKCSELNDSELAVAGPGLGDAVSITKEREADEANKSTSRDVPNLSFPVQRALLKQLFRVAVALLVIISSFLDVFLALLLGTDNKFGRRSAGSEGVDEPLVQYSSLCWRQFLMPVIHGFKAHGAVIGDEGFSLGLFKLRYNRIM